MSGFWVLRDAEVRERCVEYLRTLPLNKGLKVVIEKDKKTPSQRAWFHVVVRIVAQGLTDQGEMVSEDDLKYSVKKTFLPPKIVKNVINGEFKEEVRSTEDLSKEDYSHMTEKLLIFAASKGINVPAPSTFGLEAR